MKILHTSDWHIGQRFYRYERDEEHARFFGQLAQILRKERPDAMLVSGDIFDTAAPSAQAQRMLVHALMDMRRASPGSRIILTAGNHDSGSRIDSLRRLWAEVGVIVVGTCARDVAGLCDLSQFLVDIDGKGVVAAVPYFSGKTYPAVCVNQGREVRQKEFFQAIIDSARVMAGELPVALMAHLSVSDGGVKGDEGLVIGGIEADDISALGKGYDYLALGHIHKPHWVGASGRARYCGSPFAMSFAEEHRHFVDIVELDGRGAMPRVRNLQLDPLRDILTIPKDGASLEDALKVFAELDAECAAYVRLLVDEEGLLPADAADRANAIAEGKKCRFCEIKKAVKPAEENRRAAGNALEIDEIRALSPFDMAADAYERRYGEPLPASLSRLLNEAIAAAREACDHRG